MRKFILLICFIGIALLLGCNPSKDTTTMVESSSSSSVATSAMTLATTRQVTLTMIPPSSTVRDISTETPIPTVTETATPTPIFPLETRLKYRCLEVTPTLPSEPLSSGILVLESINSSDILFLDITTGKVTNSENQVIYAVSPDRKLLAYDNFIYNEEGENISEELVIATADGQRLAAVPWEEGWVAMPAWLDNQHVILNLSGLNPEENTSRKPATMLVLNPFTGERQIVVPDFPQYIQESWTKIPWWEGWSGVVYNPTFTRAVYPRLIEGTEGYDALFTYALWDLAHHQLVMSLENSFAYFALYNDFPLPRWSLDGSQFVFRSVIPVSDEAVEFELIRVSEEGQAEQLTHLTSVAVIQDSNLSWSPNGRYIAMFLNYWDDREANSIEGKAHVAVLDTETLEVTDYCISTPNKGAPAPVVWAPDSTQFLVADRYDEHHQRVILIDIVKGFAAQIAEDMEPVGWMLAP